MVLNHSNFYFKKSLFCIALFLALTIWWVIITIYFKSFSFLMSFSAVYGIMSLVGGIYGITISKKWGYKSLIGKSVLVFSLGLFAQYFGQLVYSYYGLFKNVEVPYPSIGDLGYFGSILFYIYGTILLAKASGVKIQFNSFLQTIQSILIPIAIPILGYSYFLSGYQFDWSHPIKIFLDFAYPFGQGVYLSLAILTYILSKGKLGGLMKNKILFLLGTLFFQFLCDYTFLYQSSRGLWYVGGVNDFMYLTSYFLMTIALLQLGNKHVKQLLLPKIKNGSKTFPLQTEDMFAALALKIITEEGKIIGKVAWDLALGVEGVLVDTSYTLRLVGNKNEVINNLISQYEKIFGESSRDLAKDAIKEISTLANSLCINAIISLNLKSAFFFVPQVSTGNFESIFPFGQEKFKIDRHHSLAYYLMSHKNLVIGRSIPSMIQQAATIAEANDLKEISSEMEKYQAEITAGIYSDDQLIGLLLLGSKNDQGIFTNKDLEYLRELLSSLSSELAMTMHFRNTQASLLQHQPKN